MRLELSDLPPKYRAQAAAQIAATAARRGNSLQKQAAAVAGAAGWKPGSKGEYEYYIGEVLPKMQAGIIVEAKTQTVYHLLDAEEYGNVKLPAARYTADFELHYADGTVEVVEVKSKFTRRMQRDYIYRRRLFIDLVAKPRGWKFTEVITADSRDDIKQWRKLTKED